MFDVAIEEENTFTSFAPHNVHNSHSPCDVSKHPHSTLFLHLSLSASYAQTHRACPLASIRKPPNCWRWVNAWNVRLPQLISHSLTHELQETNSKKRNSVRNLDSMNSPRVRQVAGGWPIHPPYAHSIERSEGDNHAVEPLILIKWTWTHDCCNFHVVSELQGISIKTENR